MMDAKLYADKIHVKSTGWSGEREGEYAPGDEEALNSVGQRHDQGVAVERTVSPRGNDDFQNSSLIT